MVTTLFEQEGVTYELEQFAYPLHGPPAQRRGDIPLVLLQQLTVTESEGRSRRVSVGMSCQRTLRDADGPVRLQRHGTTCSWKTSNSGKTLLVAGGDQWKLAANTEEGANPAAWRAVFGVALMPHASARLRVYLPSPPIDQDADEVLERLSYDAARKQTLRFWANYVARGATFEVPDPAVNTLFRASLWHALCLPRRHGGAGESVAIDLPYSNFAYDQTGTPWPVNQAVYVDYMLYDLRGFHDISAEELATIYRNNQQPDGRVGGYANWGVYTPSMVYAVAKHFLLSGDRASFQRLLPATMKAADWCVAQIRPADARRARAWCWHH